MSSVPPGPDTELNILFASIESRGGKCVVVLSVPKIVLVNRLSRRTPELRKRYFTLDRRIKLMRERRRKGKLPSSTVVSANLLIWFSYDFVITIRIEEVFVHRCFPIIM